MTHEGWNRPCRVVGQVGACAVALKPLHDLIAAHVLAAERMHGDDTPVPVLAAGKTDTARAWVHVRDDAPFGGSDPPAALFRYSPDRSGDHPVEHLQTIGIMVVHALLRTRRRRRSDEAHDRRRPLPPPLGIA